jgi:hypothetical protein
MADTRRECPKDSPDIIEIVFATDEVLVRKSVGIDMRGNAGLVEISTVEGIREA